MKREGLSSFSLTNELESNTTSTLQNSVALCRSVILVYFFRLRAALIVLHSSTDCKNCVFLQ
jgi:hypothetical protein